jgi:hypothetical protein
VLLTGLVEVRRLPPMAPQEAAMAVEGEATVVTLEQVALAL